jgi:AraC-like DNA-binding protein
MRPQLLKVSSQPGHSFSVRRDLTADSNSGWHFHPEVELIHFKQGYGTQFMGDNISRFKSGDVVLVGANLPHHWRFDKQPVDVRVAHFSENCWGASFLHLPENVRLKTLLQKAKQGLQVHGPAKQLIATHLERLLHSEGMSRMILLMETLHILTESSHLYPLASIGFGQNPTQSGHERIDIIYDYSRRHFRRAILLEEISAVANISPNSFCRFFKSRTNKTWSRFLLELRVGHACKLLIENNLSIKQICFESGFNNFTGFYKYFKLITGKSPLGYQKLYTHEQDTLGAYVIANARLFTRAAT